jgi:hypothetical protein
MSQYQTLLDDHLDYDEICSAAACGSATPDEWMRLGPHLEVCAECRSQLYKYIQMNALVMSDRYTEVVAGSVRKGDRSYEEFDAECERLKVKTFLYAWGETNYGPQRVTLLILRTPEDRREHCIWYKDNPDAPIAPDFLFARIERRHAPGTQAGRKQALFFYWSYKPESMWEAVYDSWDLVT